MNHRLCPRWNVGAVQGVRGTGRERIDKGTREKGVFSFHRTSPSSRQSIHETYFLEHSCSSLSLSLITRKRPHDTQKENSFSNVVGGGKRRPYVKLLPILLESSNFLLEDSISSNVYFRKRGTYVYIRVYIYMCAKE